MFKIPTKEEIRINLPDLELKYSKKLNPDKKRNIKKSNLLLNAKNLKSIENIKIEKEKSLNSYDSISYPVFDSIENYEGILTRTDKRNKNQKNI